MPLCNEPICVRDTIVQQTGSILIIDQEPIIVDLLVEILTDEGYIAYTAPDGVGALVAIARHPPVLILLDVGRRGLRGAALIEIRARGWSDDHADRGDDHCAARRCATARVGGSRMPG